MKKWLKATTHANKILFPTKCILLFLAKLDEFELFEFPISTMEFFLVEMFITFYKSSENIREGFMKISCLA